MGEKEINIFFVSVSVVLLILFATLFFIIAVYRKRKMEHITQTRALEEMHRREMISVKSELQAGVMKQIGEELHDTVNQRLTLAYLHTGNMKKLEDASALKKAGSEIGEIILLALNEIRDFSRILSAESFSSFGICGFLEKELSRVQQAGVCATQFELRGEKPSFANEKTELILTRICQEFIQNSLKHSGAKKLSIIIKNQGSGLTISCCDDGKGFDADAIQFSEGQGLANMNSRAAMIGARLQWEKNNGGTSLTIIV